MSTAYQPRWVSNCDPEERKASCFASAGSGPY
jgi:hypothetical protein